LQKATDKGELMLLRLPDESTPGTRFMYGSRRMKKYLDECRYSVNRKRVQRLLQKLGFARMSPGPNTSKPHPQHKIYPYRLRGVDIIRPNQAWSTDITYIRLPRGFVYLVAIMGWYSRKVLSWRLSNTLDAGFAWIVWKKPSPCTAHRPFSIPTKARNSPATPLPACCGATASRSVWMAEAGHWIIFLSSGCSER
jgi:hypothetical protein